MAAMAAAEAEVSTQCREPALSVPALVWGLMGCASPFMLCCVRHSHADWFWEQRDRNPLGDPRIRRARTSDWLQEVASAPIADIVNNLKAKCLSMQQA